MKRTASPRAGGLPNLPREYPEPPPPELPGARLLVLMEGGLCLVNAILITGLRARSKVVPRFATIPTSQVTGDSMDGFNLPSPVHNMDNI
jgi:hypothetical protein